MLKGISIFQKDSLWHVQGEVERYIINLDKKKIVHMQPQKTAPENIVVGKLGICGKFFIR